MTQDSENIVLDTVAQFIAGHNLLDSGQCVQVGFSGGPDSTALLLILTELGYGVKAVHFNHGLRGHESDDDANWCRDFCVARQIPFECVCLDVTGCKDDIESIEMAARRLRLSYWEGVNSTAVALGHHKDDALETFLLNMCRGANASSLSSLKPLSHVGAVTLVRPLLCLTRNDVCEFLAEKGVNTFRHDSSNDDTVYQRNLIRNDVLPLLENVAGGRKALYRTLGYLSEDAEFIEGCVPEMAVVTPEILQTLAAPLRFRAIRNWLISCQKDLGLSIGIPGRAIERVLSALTKPLDEPLMIDLDADHFIRMSSGRPLRIVDKTVPGLSQTVNWDWKQENTCSLPEIGVKLTATIMDEAEDTADSESFDLDMMPDQLIVRARRDGDRMIPFGSHTPKKVKRLISDAKLEYIRKQHLILVCHPEGDVLWVPHVKRAEVGRVTDKTTHVLTLRVFDSKP